jgi:histidinol dehydrogenase
MAPATEKELTMQANPIRHITADAFRKRTAVARAEQRALRRMSDSIIACTRHEGFPAHEAAVRIRLEDAR